MKGRKGFPFLGVVVAALLLAAAFLYLERWEEPGGEQDLVPAEQEAPKAGKTLKGPPPGGPAAAPRAGQRIAILIDDIGYDLPLAKALASLPAPIAFAILPQAPHAAEADALLHAAGKEILLHLPMEPLSYPDEDPGPGALFVAMDPSLIGQRLEEALAAVPHARGVNNHMGSRFMAHDAGLAAVMASLARQGLFFVDSRTSPQTRGKEAAARAGVAFAARDLFIDHRPGVAAAREALLRETLQNRPHGELLLIGHPHPETLQALKEALPRWQKEGARLLPLSALVRPPAAGTGNKGEKEKRS
jgi:polysaccharide deacetylase 2 family uncharacterized protein YibQ